MRYFNLLTVAAMSTLLSTAALADGGFEFGAKGFNFGNWATGGAGASGTVDMNGNGSVDNWSGTNVVATLGGGCNCPNSVVATDTAVAVNNIVLNGQGTATSSTAATSAAGVGYGAGGSVGGSKGH
jgi:hypothetical protein